VRPSKSSKHTVEEKWIPRNGAPVSSSQGPGTDPEFKKRLLANGRAAYVDELGLTRMPRAPPVTHVVKENTPTLQDSDLLHALLVHGILDHRLPPDWYKDLEYRLASCARSRTVLKEMGLDLPPSVESACGTPRPDTRTWCCRAARAHRGLAEEKAREDRHQGRHDRRRAALGSAHGRHA
jgi:nitrile hydratase